MDKTALQVIRLRFIVILSTYFFLNVSCHYSNIITISQITKPDYPSLNYVSSITSSIITPNSSNAIDTSEIREKPL